MKSIIEGKIYNTETADQICQGDNGLSTTDCYYQSEELYRTQKGAYFVCNCQNVLIPIDDDGYLTDSPQLPGSGYSITDWFSIWNIANLDQREIDFFGISEA